MKHVGTFFGAAIAGTYVFTVWGALAGAYGLAGGWFAGATIVGIMWFLNHFVGSTNNDGAWVDMGLGIGVAGTAKPAFINGWDTVGASLPTLALVCLGGILGAVAAGLLQKAQANQN